MTRFLRTVAAVVAGVALVAALPAPCGCPPERTASRQADEHACCAPPAGVSAAPRGCCDETPASTEAVPSSGGVASAPVAVADLRAAVPSLPAELPRPSVVPAASPPPTVLRI